MFNVRDHKPLKTQNCQLKTDENVDFSGKHWVHQSRIKQRKARVENRSRQVSSKTFNDSTAVVEPETCFTHSSLFDIKGFLAPGLLPLFEVEFLVRFYQSISSNFILKSIYLSVMLNNYACLICKIGINNKKLCI